MADVKLEHIYKVYPNGVKAVNDFSIDIKDKEFIVFVGPSGCGKSTTLRMIAGLEDISAGDLYIDHNYVNDCEPKDRDIAMVFQNYALYPHMTVYENMAFGLKNRKVSRDIINEKVLEAAKILDIEDYLQRKPKEMSGGQRQRVALGRAIVRDPKVFLLDEPLSNLDAKLRAQMRTEITKLHKKLGTTFIYVTHDQIEAMTMGTRIVVMKNGFVQQIDSPLNLYRYPNNKFVAGFIGTPQMNFFDVVLSQDKESVKIKFNDVENISIPSEHLIKMDKKFIDGVSHVTMGIRPDDFIITNKANKETLPFVISSIEALGPETLLYGNLASVHEDDKISALPIIVKASNSSNYNIGDSLNIRVNYEFMHFFDNKVNSEEEPSILLRIPNYFRLSIKDKANSIILLDKQLKNYETIYNEIKGKVSEAIIPLSAVKKGEQFNLPVFKIEDIDGQKLLCLAKSIDDEKVFLVDNEFKGIVGDEYGFDIDLEFAQLNIENTIVEGVNNSVNVLAKFVKAKEVRTIEKEINKDGKKEIVKVNKKLVVFYFEAEGYKIEVPIETVAKFTAIEGNKIYSMPYRLEFNAHNSKICTKEEEAGFKAKVQSIKQYGDHYFVEVMIGEKKSYLPVEKDFKADEIKVAVNFEDIGVYTTDSEIKIG